MDEEAGSSAMYLIPTSELRYALAANHTVELECLFLFNSSSELPCAPEDNETAREGPFLNENGSYQFGQHAITGLLPEEATLMFKVYQTNPNAAAALEFSLPCLVITRPGGLLKPE